MKKVLVVVCGPTAIGKTTTSIVLAKALGTDVISADSRQFYRELKIGTAAPTASELEQVKHHFAGHISVLDYYNVSIFEREVLLLLDNLFQKSPFVILTGGSGLYIDAVCHGIDYMPDICPEVRQKVEQYHLTEGIEGIRSRLRMVDPEYYWEVDIANPKRMMRGLEVYLSSGIKYSEFRTRKRDSRDFLIKKILLSLPRQQLYDRINQRTDAMISSGLIEEATSLYSLRHLNALNTVGYKELFDWLDTRYPLREAIEKIKTNTRRYAKRQLTWFARYTDAKQFDPSDINSMLNHILNNDPTS